MVIEGEVLNDFPRFVDILIAKFAAGGAINLVLKMEGNIIIKNLDLELKIDAMMRDFLEPPMLDRTDFASWQQRIRLYCQGKENGATNILLQGLPKDIYSLINHYTDAKDIWDNVKMLLEGSELTKEDRESQLMQLNSKFVNNMLPEWGRVVTAVKLNRGLRDSNYDQLYVNLKQHEGRQNKGEGNNTRGVGTAGYRGAQNRVEYANPGQARQIKCYNCNGIGHLARNCTQPKRPQNSEYFKDKMLLMQAQENGVSLDEEQLLFIAGGQDNVVDKDVDEQLVQDLALDVDNVFQADDCDAFDSNVDEASTAQTLFMANLSLADPIYDKANPSYDSDVLSEVHDHDHYQDAVCEHHEYVKDNAVQVVQSDVSAVPNDAYMMILNDMHEPPAQQVYVTTQTKVLDKSLNAELVTYKEQFEMYERRVRFELTEREQKIDEQLRIVITDRNIKEANLKKELHSVKMQLASTINHNKSLALTTEIKEMKTIFDELKADVDQNDVNRKCDEIKQKNLLIANDTLIANCLSKEVFYIATNSELNVSRFSKMHDAHTVVQARCLELETELSKLKDKIQKDDHDVMVKHFSNLEVQYLNLRLKYQHLKEDIGNNNSLPAQDGPDFDSVFEIKKLNASIQGKDNAIRKLRTQISQLQETHSVTPKVFAPGMYAIDVEPIPLRIRNNMEVHLDYLKHLKESVATLREIVEEAKVERPLDRSVASACLYTKHSQELLEYVIVTYSCIDASGSNPRSNTKKNKISPAKSVNKKAVEDHSRTNKSYLQNLNCVDSSISSKRTVINSNSDYVCQTCNKCLISTNHDMCVIKHLNSVNALSSAKSVVRKVKQVWKPKHVKQVWKATGTMLITVGYQWKPTRRIFTLREQCPLTSFTHPKVVPDKQQENVSTSKSVIIENSSHTSQKPLTRQFCDSDLEVAFRKHSCYVRDSDGVELIKGSRGSNLYTILVKDMMKSSPICLLSKASKTKSWLWHHRLNHLNFGTINDLARKDLVRGLPRLKFEKAHLCSAVGIFHQKSIPRTPQQNGVVERRNCTLVEAARIMLIFSKASMFLSAEAIATACYTQNCSLIYTRHNKTLYELVHNKKPDFTFFRIFGALCYPTNDSEDLGKLQPTADIGIFVGYAPSRNGPAPTFLTPGQISSGLVPNLTGLSCSNSFSSCQLSGTPSSTAIDQDAPSPSHSLSSLALQSQCLHQGVAAESTLMDENPFVPVDNDPFINIFALEPTSAASSSVDASSANSTYVTQTLHHLKKWSKDHPIDNVISNPSRPVFTRKQLATDALWCLYNSVLSKVEPKNFKSAITKDCKFQAMQDE
nr:integrase, catalytic region, zinc finger, CCHC-type, peptidase aspartic, catalytic [Tanacetum cinerariifolium]